MSASRDYFVEHPLSPPRVIPEGDVFSVTMHTVRTAEDVQYIVSVGLRSLAAHAFEEGEDEIGVWSYSVPFGHTDATVAGGAAFVQAARRQEEVANEWARRVS